MPRRFDKIAWSPDGESVCYFADGKLLRHRFNQPPEIIARPKSSPWALAVSPDGGLLLYTQPCGFSWPMLLTACETASGKEHFLGIVSGRCFQIVAYSPEQAEKFRTRLSQEEDQ